LLGAAGACAEALCVVGSIPQVPFLAVVMGLLGSQDLEKRLFVKQLLISE